MNSKSIVDFENGIILKLINVCINAYAQTRTTVNVVNLSTFWRFEYFSCKFIGKMYFKVDGLFGKPKNKKQESEKLKIKKKRKYDRSQTKHKNKV